MRGHFLEAFTAPRPWLHQQGIRISPTNKEDPAHNVRASAPDRDATSATNWKQNKEQGFLFDMRTERDATWRSLVGPLVGLSPTPVAYLLFSLGPGDSGGLIFLLLLTSMHHILSLVTPFTL